MICFVNLEFFKGGSSVREVEKREPKSDQLKAMDDAVYKVMGGFLSRYGGVTMPDLVSYYPSGSGSGVTGAWDGDYGAASGGKNTGAGGDTQHKDVQSPSQPSVPSTGSYNGTGWGEGGYLDTAFDRADALAEAAQGNSRDLLRDVPGYMDKSGETLDKAQKYAVDSTDRAAKFYDNSDWYLAQHKDLLSNGTNAGLENAVDAMNQSVWNGLEDSMGAGLNDLAARGIMNSSTANRSIQAIEDSAAEAAAANWGNVYNSMLSNYLGGAEASKGLAESTLGTLDQTVNNYTALAQGYRDLYDSGLEGLKTFADLPSTYYEAALAPLLPAYNYWNQATQSWLANDKDYIATSGGK